MKLWCSWLLLVVLCIRLSLLCRYLLNLVMILCGFRCWLLVYMCLVYVVMLCISVRLELIIGSMFGCSILMVMVLFVCMFCFSFVKCICVIDVFVIGLCLNLLNSLLIGVLSDFLMIVIVMVELNGGIWFCSFVSLFVKLIDSRLWCVDSIWLNFMKIGFRFLSV